MDEIKQTLNMILNLQRETAKDIGRLEERIDKLDQKIDARCYALERKG